MKRRWIISQKSVKTVWVMNSGACEGNRGMARTRMRIMRVLQRAFESELVGILRVLEGCGGSVNGEQLGGGGAGASAAAAIVECRLGEGEVRETY